jgi:NADPH:quinone reductase-like Zn-dependent oxidoreductase
VILYTKEDFLEAVRRLTGGRGVDVVYDSVGKTTAEKSLDCLVPRGMMVFFGNASGPVPPIDPLALSRKGSLFLTRPNLVHYIADRASLEARAADVLGRGGGPAEGARRPDVSPRRGGRGPPCPRRAADGRQGAARPVGGGGDP